MDLQTLALDVYQSAIITGIKLNAIQECLTNEQKKSFNKSVEIQTAEMKEKLKDKKNTEEILEILRSIHNLNSN